MLLNSNLSEREEKETGICMHVRIGPECLDTLWEPPPREWHVLSVTAELPLVTC